MRKSLRIIVALVVFCILSTEASAQIVKKITLRGQEDCPFAEFAEYGIYIPDVRKIDAILVLQHGCGMERFGITRNHDLQYQAFARKWNLMIIETALHGDCGIWHHPESGSAKALFKVIEMQAREENHPELKNAPLLLFGHSSGGHWTLGMLRDYPERILAAVTYSAAWDPQWNYKPAAAEVPVLLRHAGQADGPSCLCELTAVHHFQKLRAIGGPAAIAYNPGEHHNLSRLRHMAIPFYEAALKQRLPKGMSRKLRPVNLKACWLGDPETREIFPVRGYEGNTEGLCLLLDEQVALKWQEYVSTNDVKDVTPPPAPYGLAAERLSAGTVRISWKADADVESGIANFAVSVNGETRGTVPSDGNWYQNFDTNGDNTYPVDPLPMELLLNDVPAGATIAVRTMNQYGLVSEETTITLE